MLKRISTIFLSALVLSILFSAFSVNSALAVTSDVATITFDTEAAIPNFYSEGDIDVTYAITDEYAYTGRSLKITMNVPDASVHEARILMDAGKLRLPNFNNCTIQAHVLFPVKSDKIWGPGTQSVTLIATDPSWVEQRSDSTLYGAWQTLTLQSGSNDNNKSFGFYFPVAGGNAGEVVCYIDDIRIIKDDVVVDTIDMDASFTYPMPTDTATFATTAATTIDPAENEDNTDEVTTTTTPVPDPDSKQSSSPLIIILIVSLVIIAAIAGIIYFFVWKSKNKYY